MTDRSGSQDDAADRAEADAPEDHGRPSDDRYPGTSIGPRPRPGDFGASEAEQRRSLGLPDGEQPDDD